MNWQVATRYISPVGWWSSGCCSFLLIFICHFFLSSSSSIGKAFSTLIVRLSFDPSAWIATQDEFTALVVDEDQYRERNGRQPPINSGKEERKLMIKKIKDDDDGKLREFRRSAYILQEKPSLTSKGTYVDPCPCRACTKGRLPWPSRTGGQSWGRDCACLEYKIKYFKINYNLLFDRRI